MLGIRVKLLFILLCLYVNEAYVQECGRVLNAEQARIQAQGPPGKVGPAAEIDYGKIMEIVTAVVKAEIAELRKEINDEKAASRLEIEKIRSESNERGKRMSEELMNEMAKLRNDATVEMAALRLEIEKVRTESKEKTKAVPAEANGECGEVINENRNRMQTQGPPGKRGASAVVNYKKITDDVLAMVKTEIEAEMEDVWLKVENRCSKTNISSYEINSRIEQFPRTIEENMTSSTTSLPSLDPLLQQYKAEVNASSNTSQTLRKIQTKLELLSITPQEVKRMAEEHESNKTWIPSIALFYSAAKMDKSPGDSGARFIRDMLQDMREVVQMMPHEKTYADITKQSIIPLMQNLLMRLQKITNRYPELSPEHLAWCFKDIAMSYGFVGDNIKALQLSVQGINFMKKKFGEDANKYKVFGKCLNNAGVASYGLNLHEKAIEYYEEAVKVFTSATDFATEAERETDLTRTRTNIGFAKYMMDNS